MQLSENSSNSKSEEEEKHTFDEGFAHEDKYLDFLMA